MNPQELKRHPCLSDQTLYYSIHSDLAAIEGLLGCTNAVPPFDKGGLGGI
ncbi:hypothetical protein [Spartinivicinus poritis]|uniref:Uncharacterized protein n=1 Tax=Spartinivicinus poritis TaxID=2994640 RepID=A0ABT5UFJ9_9GAMM|nr:hypothetical protein [Spartinivicinus sp. A2-2]MDE1464970.1 hypothetical protein [Spartinivicinus sp. A2-2]